MLESDAIGMRIHIYEAFFMVWKFQACHMLQLSHCQSLESPGFFILQATSGRMRQRKNRVAVFWRELQTLPQ